MENGVRSNQHCCHDYVQFTPTCNQATASATTKLMWQWQVDRKSRGGQEARAGGCLARRCLFLSSSSLCIGISIWTQNTRQSGHPLHSRKGIVYAPYYMYTTVISLETVNDLIELNIILLALSWAQDSYFFCLFFFMWSQLGKSSENYEHFYNSCINAHSVLRCEEHFKCNHRLCCFTEQIIIRLVKMKLPQIIFDIKTKGICSEVTQAAASVISHKLKCENGYSVRACVCRGWKQNTICHSLKIVCQ